MSNTLNIEPLGFVRLIDTMPTTTAESLNLDSAVVQAARISTGTGLKTPKEDKALIRYLMRNKHTSPFEMVEFKFHLKMPIFVARQWMRHRMASINEYSARYSEVPDECFLLEPCDVRMQSDGNKQSSASPEIMDIAAYRFTDAAISLYSKAYQSYSEALAAGVAREQARTILPQSMYTEFYWKIDLHNFLHFTRLRADKHAQKEIQDFASACYSLVEPLAPIVCEAFTDYVRESITLSKQEILAINKVLTNPEVVKLLQVAAPGLGKTELLEFESKLKRLGIESVTKGK